MGIFGDILKRPRAVDSDNECAELLAGLTQVKGEREAAEKLLAALDEKRAALIIEDADADRIIALDREADAARIVIDKADYSEAVLTDQLNALQVAEEESEYRDLYCQRHAACASFAEAYVAALQALAHLRRANAILAVNKLAKRYSAAPEPPPPVLDAETFERFLQREESIHDREAARQARNPLPPRHREMVIRKKL